MQCWGLELMDFTYWYKIILVGQGEYNADDLALALDYRDHNLFIY